MARKRQKRDRKRREAARSRSGSPYRLIGSQGEPMACYINRDWKDGGSATIFILRRAPRGGHAMAAYLVDLWCMGLKDAWGRLDISYTEFSEGIIQQTAPHIELVRVDLDTARRLVMGGIRFARQNGFRLPPRYQRWVALLGGGDSDSDEADLSDFGVDGKLCFVGNEEDLGRRLIEGTVEEFLARRDVEHIVGDDDFTLMDDETLEIEAVFDKVYEQGLSAIRQWCFANGEAPHPRLAEAWEASLTTIIQADEAWREDEEPSEAELSKLRDEMDTLLTTDPKAAPEIRAAQDQIGRYMQQFESSNDAFEAFGFSNDPDEWDMPED